MSELLQRARANAVARGEGRRSRPASRDWVVHDRAANLKPLGGSYNAGAAGRRGPAPNVQYAARAGASHASQEGAATSATPRLRHDRARA